MNVNKPGLNIESTDKMIGTLEKEGLLFLEPVQNSSKDFYCVIPFLTLYWLNKNNHNRNFSIPILDKISDFISPEESENSSLHIMMSKLWGLTMKNNLQQNSDGLVSVKLSDLVSLQSHQEDIEILFKPIFKIMSSSKKIEINNETFKQCAKHKDCIAFLNAKGASCVDSIIFSNPIIGIQEKQSVIAKTSIINGKSSKLMSFDTFTDEREKFIDNGIFILITDANHCDFEIGPRDVFIGSDSFDLYAGPFIAMRKLYSLNNLNEDFIPKAKSRKINLTQVNSFHFNSLIFFI